MKILVPIDFSKPSEDAYQFALDMARSVVGQVEVVHMVELPMLTETTFGIQPYPFDPALIQRLEEKVTAAFEHMRHKFPSQVPVRFTPIHDQVVPGIRSFIEENNIDLVIMSTHGASALDEFFIGSTAEKIARFSPVPVLAIPKMIRFDSIKNIVFPNSLNLNQQKLLTHVQALQRACKAKLHVLLINSPLHFNSDEQSKKLLEKFAQHYNLHDFTLNFRNHQHERGGIIAFMNEIKADMVAMSTHGRTGLAHFIKGSIAESVLNGIDHPIWTWKQEN